ncbi:hypothetical protein GCM10011610_56030 [Nocardia rhizosphaerihabitans]|uniref:HTH merR-type domain-containing protein n=1 Tax=Nocardia rhizosphaerihabitans TaxID=1691570 RepID=A0ABQ2KV54_9NOCA|nr:hypothetical protein GCM10011610_56030 [Nocardia rhizosphaerihabitans]
MENHKIEVRTQVVSPHDPIPAAQAVYAISVAAELAGIGVQTLCLYEPHGLVTPARSAGGTRLGIHSHEPCRQAELRCGPSGRACGWSPPSG